jgi:hypothetical protein
MIDKAIQNLAVKNSDELIIEILNVVNNESDFNNYVNVLNKSKPSYLTWSNVQSEISLLKQEEANKETTKATAKQKLINLGLTDAEIKALIGI